MGQNLIENSIQPDDDKEIRRALPVDQTITKVDVSSIKARANRFKSALPLQNLYQKATSDSGKITIATPGPAGTRNLREVLPGILYRSGNFNPKGVGIYEGGSQDLNRAPLTPETLERLCQLGFRSAVYLYSRNKNSVQHKTFCDGSPSGLSYESNAISNEGAIHKILADIHATIMHPELGPILVHCWNGWHASGLISALALRQFCGWTGNEALSYWLKAADNTVKMKSPYEPLETGYAGHVNKIMNYQPHPEWEIPQDVASEICPKQKEN